jgi:glucose-6-phosphate isomerase/transaldolase/glucose-6-phosphate isomerase
MSEAMGVEETLGALAPEVERVFERLRGERVVERIWAKDHTVWGKGPAEVVDRLGWLTLPDTMAREIDELERFGSEVREEGTAGVALLGMGGSSLGAEVLRSVLGPAPGHPPLAVLDSTVPGWVEAARRGLDPARALFLVSSKSGTTVEVSALFRYFWQEVERAVGGGAAGRRFVAVTDPGTALARLAAERGFRRTFENPPDVGGRFSVLSYFGLVPAALLGLPLAKLLMRAMSMARESNATTPPERSPAVRLGAVLAAAAAAGRDKLTLLASPGLAAFGLWAEQLIAESTGKEGRGILPVAGEPWAAPDRYRPDRLFVALRLAGDDNAGLDAQLGRQAAAGQPAVTLHLADRFDVAAEFFRWQMATAVAGHLLGVHPFDQPDVDAAKAKTREALAELAASGALPRIDPGPPLAQALADEEPAYVALMAYLPPSAGLEEAVAGLRRRLLEERLLPTTFGYAPRLLHSTGQYHKGGPPGGLHVQLLPRSAEEGPAIPGEPYGFGTLAHAQALGDALALRERGRRCLRLAVSEDLRELTPPEP